MLRPVSVEQASTRKALGPVQQLSLPAVAHVVRGVCAAAELGAASVAPPAPGEAGDRADVPDARARTRCNPCTL